MAGRDPWGDREDWDREAPPVPVETPDREVPDREGSRLLDAVDEMRFVRDSPRTATEKIHDAIDRAKDLPAGPWQTFNVVFAYTVGPVVILGCAAIEWAFGESLARFLLAIPVAAALVFVANHIPLLDLLVPDQWDVSTYFVDPPGMVDVPIVDPPPEAGP